MCRVLEKSKSWQVGVEDRKVVQEKSREWFWKECGGQCLGSREDGDGGSREDRAGGSREDGAGGSREEAGRMVLEGAVRMVLGGSFLFCFQPTQLLEIHISGVDCAGQEPEMQRPSLSGNWEGGR